MIYLGLFMGALFVSSISQILLKRSADIKYENRIREYLNPRVIVAYGLFFSASLITVIAYRGIPLSMGPVLESAGYVFVAILGRIFLHEKISRRKLLGLALILVGIMVFNI
jgi:eamA-like transporter family